MEQTRPRYLIDCLDLSSPRAWIALARLAAKRLTLPDVPDLARLPLLVKARIALVHSGAPQV